MWYEGVLKVIETHKPKIIVSHMAAVNHWILSRGELKNFIYEKGIASHALAPDDGQSYNF